MFPLRLAPAFAAPLLAMTLAGPAAEAQSLAQYVLPPHSFGLERDIAPRLQGRVAAQPAVRRDGASALAISPDRRGVVWAPNRASTAEAGQAALQACFQQTGQACGLFLSFQNQCGAYALDSRGAVYAAADTDRAGAQRQALAMCRRSAPDPLACTGAAHCTGGNR